MLTWKLQCLSRICLLGISLLLIAISFLEKFPSFPKGSMWFFDAVSVLSDIWFLFRFSFSETGLSFRPLCVSWVSNLRKDKHNLLATSLCCLCLCCHGGWIDLGELATISSTPAWNSSFNPREYKWRRFRVLPGYKRLKDVYCTWIRLIFDKPQKI